MKLEELTQNIHQWGVDRKIIGNGTLQGQWYKLMEEFGELCRSVAKGKSPIDDIGDIYVVLVMMEAIKNDEPLFVYEVAPMYRINFVFSLGANLMHILQDIDWFENNLQSAVSCLHELAKQHDLTLEQCVEHAWNEIKDRKGYLNEQGVFVKEES